MRRLRRRNFSRPNEINSRRLARLIKQCNRVHLELIEANDFFKHFLGINMLFFFLYALLLIFLVVFVDWLFGVALVSIVIAMFLTINLMSSAFAVSLSTDVIQWHFV